MNSQSTSVPVMKRMRITHGDWPRIRVEYNAEHCTNRTLRSLVTAYSNSDPRVIEAVTRFYKGKNAEIRRIFTEAQEVGIITEEQSQ